MTCWPSSSCSATRRCPPPSGTSPSPGTASAPPPRPSGCPTRHSPEGPTAARPDLKLDHKPPSGPSVWHPVRSSGPAASWSRCSATRDSRVTACPSGSSTCRPQVWARAAATRSHSTTPWTSSTPPPVVRTPPAGRPSPAPKRRPDPPACRHRAAPAGRRSSPARASRTGQAAQGDRLPEHDRDAPTLDRVGALSCARGRFAGTVPGTIRAHPP